MTITVKLFVTLKDGTPSSVTLTAMTFVLGPCASVGVHVKTPRTGSMLAPVGAETKLKVSMLAGANWELQ